MLICLRFFFPVFVSGCSWRMHSFFPSDPSAFDKYELSRIQGRVASGVALNAAAQVPGTQGCWKVNDAAAQVPGTQGRWKENDAVMLKVTSFSSLGKGFMLILNNS